MGFIRKRLLGMSPTRRSALHRRLLERCESAETFHGEDSPQYLRALAILGRFSALTA